MIEENEVIEDKNICHHCKNEIKSEYAYAIQLWQQHADHLDTLFSSFYNTRYSKPARVFFCEGCWGNVAGVRYTFNKENVKI